MRTRLEESRRELVAMWTKLVAKCFHYPFVAVIKISNGNDVRWEERFLGPGLQWVHCKLAPYAGTQHCGWKNVTITDRKGPGIMYPARAGPHVTSFSQTLTPTVSTTSSKQLLLLATGCITHEPVGDGEEMPYRFNP